MTRDRRVFVGVRLSAPGLAAVQALAAKEADGNVSEMIRKLLREALAAREKRVSAR